MKLIYTATADGETITAAGDMLELLAPSTAVVILHSLYISQSTEAADAQSEQVSVRLNRVSGVPTSGSGGTSVTPVAIEAGLSAASSVVEANNTTDLSGGTSVVLHKESFNVMNGLALVWTPETRPIISPGHRFLLELTSSPADSITFDYTLYFEELGC